MNEERRAEEAAQSDSTADTSEEGTEDTTDSTEDTDGVYLTASETTFGADDDSLDEALKDAAETLTDGQVYGEVIEGEDAYYVVRMDSVLDREATDEEKDTIVQQRQSDAYNDLLDSWIDESDISVKRAWNKLEVTDYDLYTMTVDSSEESTDSSSDSTADTDSTANSDSAADTDSTANSDSSVNTDSNADTAGTSADE